MFELPESAVVNAVSRMMVSEELAAAWDQPTRTIVVAALNPSRLQHLALQVRVGV